MATGATSYGLLAGLAIALLLAALSDIRRREIANPLNGAVALAAPLFWWASAMPLWPEVALQLGMAGLVFGLLAGLFAAGAMGGGDVKLLAALALWLPWRGFVELIVVMALIGGVLAVVLLARQRWLRCGEIPKIPYGVAIAGGGWWVLVDSGALPGLPR